MTTYKRGPKTKAQKNAIARNRDSFNRAVEGMLHDENRKKDHHATWGHASNGTEAPIRAATRSAQKKLHEKRAARLTAQASTPKV